MEQNTDRMWWTIGAVVLGGALIAAVVLLLNTTLLPNIKTKFDEIDRPAVTHTAYSWLVMEPIDSLKLNLILIC